MAIWDIFKNAPNKNYFNTLHQKLHKTFPEDDEEQLLQSACIAGLLASVAYVDFDIHANEQSLMENALIHWMDYPENKAQMIANLAISDIKELAGVENYTYSEALANLLDKDDCYELLEVLFELAASDGGVTEKESQEIRIISKGLKLDHRHFIAARAAVVTRLESLR